MICLCAEKQLKEKSQPTPKPKLRFLNDLSMCETTTTTQDTSLSLRRWYNWVGSHTHFQSVSSHSKGVLLRM